MDNVFLALRVIVSLGVVMGAIWFVQKRVVRSGRTKSKVKPIAVIARQNLGSKASVAVVEFGGKRFLLGVTEHGVSVLDNGTADAQQEAVVAAPVAPSVAAPVAKPARKKPAPREFGDVLDDAQTANATVAATAVQLNDDDIVSTFAPSTSRLAGSILSVATWKQAYLAFRGGR